MKMRYLSLSSYTDDMAVAFQYLIFIYLTVILIENARVRGESMVEYIIWPRANITRHEVDIIESLLRRLMSDPTRLYASKSPFKQGPTFWLAVLNDDSYQRISRHPSVSVKAEFVTTPDLMLSEIIRYLRSGPMRILSSRRM